jgi:hypothetical protein
MPDTSGFLDKAKETARKATEAAKQGLDQAKGKGQVLTLKRKLNSLAGELGQIVYRQKQGEIGLDAEVDRLVSEMRGVNAEIEALTE